MALVNIEGSDPWLTEYDACEKLFREIMEQLTLRDREPRTSQTFINLSANIRLRLRQYSGEVQQLKIKVEESSKQRNITAEEAERRTRQIEQLQSKDVQIQRLFNARSTDLVMSRTALLAPSSSAFADIGTTSWAIDEDDDRPLDVHVTIEDIQSQKKRLMEEQERGLEELSKVITRQKHIAQAIHSEVDQQNEIIDDLADHVDRTDERLIEGTRTVQNISQKDKTCGYWVVIVLLFISIILATFC
ncbi:syntaxin-8 [Leptopilina boulardi]|uniref:syntaxin-8 n=1 Tax=Leptopilina boulardi TaxID=63433 RepID=UPI0021F62420|nr:syntaxin-8 [Leptopilina boulardi]